MNNQMYAGVARVDISTDKVKTNDRLYAKTLVIEKDGKKYAFVSLDYVSMGGGISELSDSFFADVKKQAQGIGIDTFVCGVTHTHTFFPMAKEETEVKTCVLESIKKACEDMHPIKVGVGKGSNSDFAINRTLMLKDGTAWSIRQAHPCPCDNEIDSLQYADDTVGVLRFDKMDGTPLCVMFAFGCHPLLGYANNLPTANYPGVAEALVERQTGAIAMMFQSCGGDVTEIDYKNYDKPKSCETWGKLLGLTVLETLKEIKAENADISSAICSIKLPRRKDISAVREKLLEEREELFASLGGCPLNFKSFLPLYMKYLVSPDYPLGYAYEYMKEEADGKTQLRNQDKINRANIDKYIENLAVMEKLSKLATTLETLEWHEKYNKSYNDSDVETEVVGVKIGKALLITAPVEPLSEIGRRVRGFSPYECTFVLGYSNGYCHYGAPSEIYNNGGYETIECMLSPDWEGIYENAVKDIIEKLK